MYMHVGLLYILEGSSLMKTHLQDSKHDANSSGNGTKQCNPALQCVSATLHARSLFRAHAMIIIIIIPYCDRERNISSTVNYGITIVSWASTHSRISTHVPHFKESL